jgi:hypothetical protein
MPRALKLAILRVAPDHQDEARAVAVRKHRYDGFAARISQARQRLGRRAILAEELRRTQQAGPTVAPDGDDSARTAHATSSGSMDHTVCGGVCALRLRRVFTLSQLRGTQ